MYAPKIKLTISLLFFSISIYGQKNISEIIPADINATVSTGYAESINLIKRTLSVYPDSQLNFRFDYSSIRTIDNDHREMYFFTGLDTSNVNIKKIEEIRFEFLYSFDKIKYEFTILYIPDEEILFLTRSTRNDLQLLDSLKRGYCAECFRNIRTFIKKRNIGKYHLSIKIIKQDQRLINRFLWELILEKRISSGGNLIFISPLLGKKADVSEHFARPQLQ